MATTAQSGPSPRKFYGWTNVGLFFFIQFAASGFVYFAYSVVFPVMVETMAWNRGTASIAQSVGLILFGLCYPLTGFLIGKYGVRRTVTIGLSLMLAGLLLSASLVQEIWHWILVWGVVVGISFSLTGPICSQTTMISWFKARRATTIGIVLTGGAVGGAIAQPALSSIMTYFDSWRAAWLVAAAMVVLAIIVTQFLVNRPEEIGQFSDNVDPDNVREAAAARNNRSRTHRTEEDWTMKEIIRQPVVLCLMLATIAYLTTFFFLLNHGVLHLTDKGVPAIEAASVMGLAILGSGIARIPAGWLGDMFELRWTVFGSLLLMGFSLLGFWFGEGVVLLSAMGMLFGAGYGSMLVLGPVVTGNYFGERAFPVINSVMAPVMLPFAAMAPVGGGYIFEETGSYDLAFTLALALIGLGLIGAFLLKPPLKPA
ncbi:MAG: MFS transporter [Parasphingorhabdus sp.]